MHSSHLHIRANMITSGGILAKSYCALRCDAATSYCMGPPQRSRSHTPIEPHPVAHNTTNFATTVEVVDGTCGTVWGGVEWKVKLSRARHCQVLALPLTHSPEGGSQWCQITPGVPTPRLQGLSQQPLPGAGAPTDPQSRRR